MGDYFWFVISVPDGFIYYIDSLRQENNAGRQYFDFQSESSSWKQKVAAGYIDLHWPALTLNCTAENSWIKLSAETRN